MVAKTFSVVTIIETFFYKPINPFFKEEDFHYNKKASDLLDVWLRILKFTWCYRISTNSGK